MGLILFLAFIVVPLVEITVIGQVQQLLGWPTTIVILILDSVIGAYLVRQQGALAWRRFQDALRNAKSPTEEVFDGALILFAGALMLTPGFVTDVVGLLALFSPTRKMLNAALRSRVKVAPTPFGSAFTFGRPPGSSSGTGPPGQRGVGFGSARPGPHRQDTGTRPDDSGPGSQGDPGVIDVEVVEVHRTDGAVPDDVRRSDTQDQGDGSGHDRS